MGDMGDLRQNNRHFGNKLFKSFCGSVDKRKLCLNTDSCFGFLSSMESCAGSVGAADRHFPWLPMSLFKSET